MSNKKQKILTKEWEVCFFIFLISLVLIPDSVNAHMDAEKKKVNNGYLIDFGYSPKILNTLEKTTLSFNILNTTNPDVKNPLKFWIEPEHVWLRISSSKEVVFAGTLSSKQKTVSISYRFPYPDNYEIAVKFIENNKTISQTKFTLKVQPTIFNYLNVFFLAIIILLIVIIVLQLKKSRR